MRTIRVGVVDENVIFRRGAVACLGDDARVSIVFTSDGEAPADLDLDVAVVSVRAARTLPNGAALVVCHGDHDSPAGIPADRILAWLPRRTLTPDQLVSAVRAADAGLRINTAEREPSLKERYREILSLLAGGAGTREISDTLGYSERTIKADIQEVSRALGARSRSQAVAEAVRQNLI